MLSVRFGCIVALALVGTACGDDGEAPSDRSASLAGRVIVAGPLRGAAVSVDQLRVDDAIGGVRMHIGDTVADADGSYQLDGFGQNNGLFLVIASGGNFTDLVSGETIVLDPTDQVRTLITLDLFEQRTDALISPVGHLIESLARARLAAGMHENLYDAREFAATKLDAHFGSVDWQRIDPAPLDQPASSATDAVRAALIADAWSILSDDIAVAAGASHQEVHAYALMEAWGRDIAAPPFDGQDGNDRAHGSGLQLGECPAVAADCVLWPPAPACSLGGCREACDLFAGMPRAALSGALLKLVRTPQFNQTGLGDTAILPLARAMAENQDEVLFGGACVDSLDRTAPTLLFEMPPTPADGAFVRGAISVRVRAVDDIDVDPDLVFLGGLTDSDGDPTNAVATAAIAATTDGPLMVAAKATDSAGNEASTSRMFVVDATDPVVTIDPTGFYVSGSDWWTANSAPMLTGTITEANLVHVKIYAGAIEVAQATVTGSTWTATLPAGAVPGIAGEDVRVEATDRAGGTGSRTQRIRFDGTPPVIATPSTEVRDERADGVTFSDTVVEPIFGGPSFDPTHAHATSGGAMLGPTTACDASAPTVYKYAYLLDEAPPYVTESGGPVVSGGRNPLRWQMSITDDGVGIDYSTVAYRVRDMAAGTYPLDWTPLTGTGSYSVSLHRSASSSPDIAALGSKEGLFEIQFRGKDRLNREVPVARCWNHRLIAAPIYIGASADAVHGPDGSGKYGLGALRLEDTATPFDPVSMMMNVLGSGEVGGAGLMQFPIVNPTNEPIYVSIDLVNPTAATYSKTSYEDWWTYTQTSASTNCGNDGAGGPNETLPNCGSVANPGPGSRTSQSGNGDIEPSTSYSVRVWEVASVTNVHTEVAPCPGCNPTPVPPADKTRVTVLLPPRGVDVVPPPPRKFVIMPVLEPLAGLQPNGSGPYSEVSAGGITLSGKIEATRSGCHAYTQISAVRWDCTTRRTYRNVRYVKDASVTGVGNVFSKVFTSWNSAQIAFEIIDMVPVPLAPPHLPTNQRTRSVVPWTTTEPTNPP